MRIKAGKLSHSVLYEAIIRYAAAILNGNTGLNKQKITARIIP